MAYIYFDENSPESSEYISNYEYFDEKEPGAIARMMRRCLKVEQRRRCGHNKRSSVVTPC